MSEQSARESYRAIIDALVGKTSPWSEQPLRSEGTYSRAPGDEAINSFTRSLSTEQLDLLVAICKSERIGGMFDVLAELTWWIDCKDLALAIDGERLPADESGMGLHGDFMGRVADFPWPD